MNPTASTLSLNRGAISPRDHSTRRRAYLDTYARKRANLPEDAPKPEFQNVIKQSVAMPMSVPVAVQQANAQPATVLQPQPQIQSQSQMTSSQVADNFRYVSNKQVEAPIVSTAQSDHSNYLSSMTRTEVPQEEVVEPRAKQTAFEETPVSEPQISQNNNSKIEANLRALYLDEDSLTRALMQEESASLSHMRTIVASAFACGIIAVSLFTFFGRTSSQPVVAQPVGAPVIEVQAPRQQPVSNAAALDNEPRRVAVNANHPVRLVIGGIGVNAPVEAVGQTPAGLMEVPKSYGIVGWYEKGVYPGQKGPAVLAGHYTGGYGGVFDKLADLKDGDLITTTNGKGENLTYKVVKKVEYEKDKVPMAELFKSGDTSRLEIITCSGKWQADTYNNRLVVTAELVR